jgi:hypothetical protein
MEPIEIQWLKKASSPTLNDNEVLILNTAREVLFENLSSPSEQSKVTQWKIEWKKLVDDQQRDFRRYHNMGTNDVDEMDEKQAMSTLNLYTLSLVNMDYIKHAWENAVLPEFFGEQEHPVKTIKKMNMGRDVLFGKLIESEKLRAQKWNCEMKECVIAQPQEGPFVQLMTQQPSVEQIDQPRVARVDQLEQQLAEHPIANLPQVEQPITKLADHIEIPPLDDELMAQRVKIENIKSELSKAKRELKEKLKSGQKRAVQTESIADMSDSSEPTDSHTKKTRLDGPRTHTKTDDNSDRSAFIEEIKVFCAEEFEESPGARIFCNELYGIFLNWRGMGEGTTLEKSMFTRHARKQFKMQWPNCKDSMSKRQWSYLNVSVKTPPQ